MSGYTNCGTKAPHLKPFCHIPASTISYPTSIGYDLLVYRASCCMVQDLHKQKYNRYTPKEDEMSLIDRMAEDALTRLNVSELRCILETAGLVWEAKSRAEMVLILLVRLRG